jgi:hypothetical protein
MTGRLERHPWVRPSELLITRILVLPLGVVVASPDAAVVATLAAESAFFLESKHTLKCLLLEILALRATASLEHLIPASAASRARPVRRAVVAAP